MAPLVPTPMRYDIYKPNVCMLNVYMWINIYLPKVESIVTLLWLLDAAGVELEISPVLLLPLPEMSVNRHC